MGDITHGEKVFKKCSACHMIAKGGKNLIGPTLWGVWKKLCVLSRLSYSKALKLMEKIGL